MLASQMISELASLMKDVGDVEVIITDGFECRAYRGNKLLDFEIVKYEDRPNCYFIDIGIGGYLEVD